MERPESLFDIRLEPGDRPGGGHGPAGKPASGKRARSEPSLDAAAESEDMAAATRRSDREPKGRSAGSRGTGGNGASGNSGSGRGKAKAPRRRRRGFFSLFGLVKWLFILGLWAAVGVGALVAYEASKLPPMQTLMVPKRPPTVMIQAYDGKALATRGDMGGAAVPLKELPAYLPRAFVAIEDRRFYEHWGLDPLGLARAMAANLVSRRVRQGGSTLTQQLAKNLFLTQERTFSRKIQELVLALWLEKKFTKNEILDLYLNRVYFGNGAYGVEAAAQRYFNKSARNVTLSEAAMLAGLVNAPSRLAPTRNLKAAQDRANLVLAAMREQGYVSEDMVKVALSRPATLAKPSTPDSIGYVADWVMDQLDSYVGTLPGDVIVRTTIDPTLQQTAQASLTDALNKQGAKYGVGQGAVVSLDTDGAVKALVGGRSYEDSQYNRAVTARRQPGSSFKPFVYLTALEKGLTPETIREDGPIQLKGWKPENASHQYLGPVPLQQALAMSLNTVSVRLALEVGPKAVVATAHRLGITSTLDPNPSIALGTSEVSVLELASAYVPFANGGIGIIPYVIDSVKGADGKVLYSRSTSGPGRVIDPAYVGMMNHMLEQTLITGTGRRAELPGWDAAGKTGTSQDYRDAWFVGYTARMVTAVWLGNDDSSPTKKASGANLPAEIWSRYMKVAHKDLPMAELPGAGHSYAGYGQPSYGQPGLLPPGQIPDEAPPAIVGNLPQQAPRPQQDEPMTLDRWFVDTFLGGRR
ncbi:transglycosylase domain-containing protein [Azorhizobium doebereinerae]|uniref:transglycosylase domain-containing protein n=1 Tax=Azorhizobium doebereinerae TaxID=281091 RepID=UPI000418441E|nr:penicillin-binding protein 1A [Azorhizobium doebereinerae]